MLHSPAAPVPALTAAALAESRKVGLGQLAVRGHEYLVALQASERGIIANTLHYEEEVRQGEEIYRASGVKAEPADPELVALAAQVMQQATAPFDPSAYRDSYEESLRAFLAEKVKSLPSRKGAQPSRTMWVAPAATSSTSWQR